MRRQAVGIPASLDLIVGFVGLDAWVTLDAVVRVYPPIQNLEDQNRQGEAVVVIVHRQRGRRDVVYQHLLGTILGAVLIRRKAPAPDGVPIGVDEGNDAGILVDEDILGLQINNVVATFVKFSDSGGQVSCYGDAECNALIIRIQIPHAFDVYL